MTEEEATPDENAESSRPVWMTAVQVGIAVVLLFAVIFFGWYQFGNRANTPVELVKEHEIPGTGRTIGEGIEAFLEDGGVEIAREGFKPSWGAEETGPDVWVVSFVFEVGREAHWVSWEVYPDSGKVRPIDEAARELMDGK